MQVLFFEIIIAHNKDTNNKGNDLDGKEERDGYWNIAKIVGTDIDYYCRLTKQELIRRDYMFFLLPAASFIATTMATVTTTAISSIPVIGPTLATAAIGGGTVVGTAAAATATSMGVTAATVNMLGSTVAGTATTVINVAAMEGIKVMESNEME